MTLGPGSEGRPVLFWLCLVENQVVLQDVYTFIDDQQGQVIISGYRAVVTNLFGVHFLSQNAK